MNPRRIGFLGFDDVTALDLVGPAEVFATAASIDPANAYEVVVIGVGGRPFRSDSGILFKPACAMRGDLALDTLIIPGGAGLREPGTNERVVTWLRSFAGAIRRVASVCTGIYGLAPTGLLDGRRITTHWKFAGDVAKRFPSLRVVPDAIFVKDGKFYTAAGVTSGIDLALALVQEDMGPQTALSVARLLVVYMKRPGGQEQFSEPLRFQIQSSDRFGELAAWMAAHLRGDLTVEALSIRASVSTRHFSRRFKHVFRSTPAAFVLSLRLNEARRLLSSGHASIEGVSESVGFGSADSFRRAFERRFGITPTGYRGLFGVRRTGS